MRGLVALLVASAALGAACGREEAPAPGGESGLSSPHMAAAPAAAPAPGPAPTAGPTPAAAPGSDARTGDPAKGRQVWLGQCAACHNQDPTKAGAIGPAVKGSSRDLLEARVLRGAYPPGYAPKRDTKVMLARPDLAPVIGDLAAYLD
jgi:mono/diheme cytochrome c family protein